MKSASSLYTRHRGNTRAAHSRRCTAAATGRLIAARLLVRLDVRRRATSLHPLRPGNTRPMLIKMSPSMERNITLHFRAGPWNAWGAAAAGGKGDSPSCLTGSETPLQASVVARRTRQPLPACWIFHYHPKSALNPEGKLALLLCSMRPNAANPIHGKKSCRFLAWLHGRLRAGGARVFCHSFKRTRIYGLLSFDGEQKCAV